MEQQESISLGRPIVTKSENRFARLDRNKSISKVAFLFGKIKLKILSRLFWGRGVLYKQFLHLFMFFGTVLVAISGLFYQLSNVDANQLFFDNQTLGSNDLISQGGSIESVLVTDPDVGGITTTNHIVAQGETLEDLSELYNVSKDTIRWANINVGTIAFTDNLQSGWELTIPELNGVIYKVKSGDTIDSIVEQASLTNDEANRFNIIEFNNLEPPYNLVEGQTLFIPDGNLRDPLPTDALDIPTGVFIDPLYDPSCVNYVFTRGYLSYHNGVDLALGGGCIISAIANGVITYAGWGSGGQGHWVEIDHGSGIKSQYFHGNGTFYVQQGDWVEQGQPIMYMGTSGNSTGTHLHFSLWKDGSSVNPRPYVPYRGRY